MAQKKPANDSKSAPAAKPMAKPAAATEVRNSAVPPKVAAPSKRDVGFQQIAQRAYELWQSRGGSEMDNWLQAERELRAK